MGLQQMAQTQIAAEIAAEAVGMYTAKTKADRGSRLAPEGNKSSICLLCACGGRTHLCMLRGWGTGCKDSSEGRRTNDEAAGQQRDAHQRTAAAHGARCQLLSAVSLAMLKWSGGGSSQRTFSNVNDI